MSLFDIGRMVVKIAGRDADRKAVVVDVLDSTFVLIDGETRRRKVNIRHLEPLAEVLPLSPGASHKEVKDVLEKAGVEVRDAKSKQTSPRPPRLRKGKKTNVTIQSP